jgi:hypothetical protein
MCNGRAREEADGGMRWCALGNLLMGLAFMNPVRVCIVAVIDPMPMGRDRDIYV